VIREIQIENFKSIKKMKLELGRVNVFIGENGSGKSNILEAIALAGAAAADKLDNEFLASRGIRAAEPRHMRCALNLGLSADEIEVSLAATNNTRLNIHLTHDGRPYSSWKCKSNGETSFAVKPNRLLVFLERIRAEQTKIEGESSDDSLSLLKRSIGPDKLEEAIAELRELTGKPEEDEDATLVIRSHQFTALAADSDEGVRAVRDFIIYSPENSSLRVFKKESQIEPLGIQGEGLLQFLQVLSSDAAYADAFASVRARLKVLGWFDDLSVPDGGSEHASKIAIKDRFLGEDAGKLDQISANEGFLFLLFYFCLFSTDLTPNFFAVDNMDASLNPKLCAHLVKEIAEMAARNGKQAILTTHNPATLDGLDLYDDEQRLFVISRGDEGETKIRRIKQKDGSTEKVKLSTAFINGYLGGLPKNF